MIYHTKPDGTTTELVGLPPGSVVTIRPDGVIEVRFGGEGSCESVTATLASIERNNPGAAFTVTEVKPTAPRAAGA
jgi:hypothetical protein